MKETHLCTKRKLINLAFFFIMAYKYENCRRCRVEASEEKEGEIKEKNHLY